MASAKKSTTGSSGGIADSGIFGLVGTTVECSADDKSLYCRFARLINILIWIFMIVAILFAAKQFFSSGNKK